MNDCDQRHDGACRIEHGMFGWHCTRPRWSAIERMEHARAALRDAADKVHGLELEARAIDYVDASERFAGVMRPRHAVLRGVSIGIVVGVAPLQAALGHPMLAALHVVVAATLTVATLWRLRR